MKASAILAVALSTVAATAAGAALPPEAPLRFLLAKGMAEEGRLDEALAELDQTIAASPDDPYLRLERVAILFQLGRLEPASTDVAHARSLAPEDVDVLRLQGRVEMARSERNPEAAAIAREALEELRSKRPDDLEVLLSLGQLYLAAGQAALAVETLQEASRLRSSHPWIESMLARALAAAGELSSAEEVLRAALERRPNDLSARFELAERLGLQGRHGEAVALLREAPVEQQGRSDFRERLARQLLFAGDPTTARGLARVLVSERPGRLGAQVLLARIEVVLGYFREAEAALQPVVGGDDGHPMVTELLVRALEGQGRFAAAAARIEAQRKRSVDGGDLLAGDRLALELAGLWSRAGSWDLASEAAFLAAASEDSAIARAALRIGARSLVRAGRIDEALSRVDDAAGLPGEPHHSRSALRIDLLLAAGRVDEAMAEAEELMAAWPLAPLVIGSSLQDHGQLARALPLLEQAVERAPESLEAGFRFATCLERLGRRDEAVERFRELVVRAPGFTPALNYLGYLWIERGENLDEAIAMVREAVRIEPDNGAYVDSLGWGEYQQRRYPQAVVLLERAARLLPDDVTVLDHLGDARAAAGDLPGATAAYRRALELGTESSAELERKLELLDGEH